MGKIVGQSLWVEPKNMDEVLDSMSYQGLTGLKKDDSWQYTDKEFKVMINGVEKLLPVHTQWCYMNSIAGNDKTARWMIDGGEVHLTDKAGVIVPGVIKIYKIKEITKPFSPKKEIMQIEIDGCGFTEVNALKDYIYDKYKDVAKWTTKSGWHDVTMLEDIFIWINNTRYKLNKTSGNAWYSQEDGKSLIGFYLQDDSGKVCCAGIRKTDGANEGWKITDLRPEFLCFRNDADASKNDSDTLLATQFSYGKENKITMITSGANVLKLGKDRFDIVTGTSPIKNIDKIVYHNGKKYRIHGTLERMLVSNNRYQSTAIQGTVHNCNGKGYTTYVENHTNTEYAPKPFVDLHIEALDGGVEIEQVKKYINIDFKLRIADIAVDSNWADNDEAHKRMINVTGLRNNNTITCSWNWKEQDGQILRRELYGDCIGMTYKSTNATDLSIGLHSYTAGGNQNNTQIVLDLKLRYEPYYYEEPSLLKEYTKVIKSWGSPEATQDVYNFEGKNANRLVIYSGWNNGGFTFNVNGWRTHGQAFGGGDYKYKPNGNNLPVFVEGNWNTAKEYQFVYYMGFSPGDPAEHGFESLQGGDVRLINDLQIRHINGKWYIRINSRGVENGASHQDPQGLIQWLNAPDGGKWNDGSWHKLDDSGNGLNGLADGIYNHVDLFDGNDNKTTYTFQVYQGNLHLAMRNTGYNGHAYHGTHGSINVMGE